MQITRNSFLTWPELCQYVSTSGLSSEQKLNTSHRGTIVKSCRNQMKQEHEKKNRHVCDSTQKSVLRPHFGKITIFFFLLEPFDAVRCFLGVVVFIYSFFPLTTERYWTTPAKLFLADTDLENEHRFGANENKSAQYHRLMIIINMWKTAIDELKRTKKSEEEKRKERRKKNNLRNRRVEKIIFFFPLFVLLFVNFVCMYISVSSSHSCSMIS